MAIEYGSETTGVAQTFTGPTVTGSDIYGFVVCGHGQSTVITGVTWDGNTMTRLTPSASRRNHIWYIAAPVSGGEVIVSGSEANTQNAYGAFYLTGLGDPDVQNADGTAIDGEEVTATLSGNTVSGAALLYFALLYGGDVEGNTLGSWEVNGSATGVTEAFTMVDSGSGFDVNYGVAYDFDGATGSTDSMSMTPVGADEADDLLAVIVEMSAATDPTKYLAGSLASTRRALTPDPPLLLSDRKA